MANYETMAVLDVVNETNPGIFKGSQPKHLAKWLKRQFRSHDDRFITTDPVLSKLDVSKVKFLPLALVLSVGGDGKILDMVFDADIRLS